MLLSWSKRKVAHLVRGSRGKGARERLRAVLAVEQLESLVLLSCDPNAVFRRIDGGCGNPFDEAAGEAGEPLLRQIPSRYADGLNVPSGGTRPSARAISNAISDQADPNNPGNDLSILDNRRLTDFIYVFGQFLDHDMDLTKDNTGQCFDIPVAANDPIGVDDSAHCPGQTHVIPLRRSEFDPNTGIVVNGVKVPREQLNSDTAFIDGSQIYGSDDTRANILRSHVNGRLRTDASGSFLPKKGDAADLGTVDMANDAHQLPDSQMFVAGDRRANETVFLAAMQTLFMREHNRLADAIHANNPAATDEEIYQRARRIVGAELQSIVYTEFIPALLGANALPAYTGFNPNVDATIKTEFSTILFRFGHSQLDNDVERTANATGDTIADGKLDLGQTFFLAPNLLGPNPNFVDPITHQHMTGITPFMKGDAGATAQLVDQFAVTDIRNLLFGPLGAGGEDLIARDIQRARDHAIPNYNALRVAYGLPAYTSFNQITRNATLAAKLSQMYGGDINNVDAFIASICEDHVPGSSVGPLVQASLVDQFRRLRDGDKFFYLHEINNLHLFNSFDLALFNGSNTLAKVIKHNTGVTNIQANVFIFTASIAGTVRDVTTSTPRPVIGATVQLLDNTNTVIATATTDGNGHYQFDTPGDFSGTGTYMVHLVPPFASTVVTTNPLTVDIVQGDIHVTNANFNVTGSAGAPGGGGSGRSLGTALEQVQGDIGTGQAVQPLANGSDAGPAAATGATAAAASAGTQAAAQPATTDSDAPLATASQATTLSPDAPASADSLALDQVFAQW
jgi:hypothetical protein